MNVSYQTSEQGFFKSLTTLLEKLNLTETKTSSDTAQLAAPDNFEDSYKHTFNDDDAETQELKIINLIKACKITIKNALRLIGVNAPDKM